MTTSVTYQPGWFGETMSTVADYLFQLRHIDHVLAFLDSPIPEGGGPAHDYLEVILGTTHPFTVTAFVPATPGGEEASRARLETRIAGYADEARSFATSATESLMATIAPVLELDPQRFASICGQLIRVQALLQPPAHEDVGGIGDSLDNWEGRAARAFAEYFYHPYQQGRRNQSDLVGRLAALTAACETLAYSSQHSAMNAAVATALTLNDQLLQRQATRSAGGRPSLKDFLTVTSTATRLIGLTRPAGPGGAALGLVSTVSGLAAAALPADLKPMVRPVSATDAAAIAHELREFFADIVRFADTTLRDVAEDAGARLGDLVALRSEGLLVPGEPRIRAGHVDPGTFRHGSGAAA
jgi:hypothetical protein